MSTTFGVKIDTRFVGIWEDVTIEDEEITAVEVAFRSNKNIHFTNPLGHLLPDETPVIPLDNDAQGIYTIGDIKREIEKEWKN